ncbi:unnamed protein product [Acanthoscelides obtectus]|uniref:HTH psq-type domain-containing protein n=1 Tax=Acanthoscelides obtectus TaxID=200917 RepID=A0A9P0PKC0_ACAOB|nr:unnamed protein product [Acanthoscelides obtectus]CAK1653524.1 hypothetical protein AOBTE_LOCUS18274 [Acanthoscelides obtectus]
MPTEYKRKGSVCRGEWSEQDLQQAIEAVQKGRVGVREAVRSFGVSYTTLRRRLRSGNQKASVGTIIYFRTRKRS